MPRLTIDWNVPLIQPEDALSFQIKDLDDFYARASEEERFQLFFILLNSLHRAQEREARESAAHLSFLTAYYLFTPLTPPASQELALHYMKLAEELHPLPLYREWIERIERGN